jgi:GT2 family glycosyltransferase
MTNAAHKKIGVVAIGRNEGERLRRCLESVVGKAAAVVYVDSGSTDGSVARAKSLGVEVVELDLTLPFTAARARNAGVERLIALHDDIEYVQVVDGDCEIVEGWLDAAVQIMEEQKDVAVVCGRRRERHPEASDFNRLCDMEWNTPVGEAQSCGGDALIRLKTFVQVGGYDSSVIAGEEPELCVRMRRRGWRIMRIDREMTLHDAQMFRFGQWWRRMVRSGHAYAEGRALHGRTPERFRVREVRSIIEWAVILPIMALALAWWTWGLSLALFLGYVALWYRVRSRRIEQGDARRDASLYASSCVIGKFPQLLGVLQYWRNRAFGRRSQIIEYKGDGAKAPREAKEANAVP